QLRRGDLPRGRPPAHALERRVGADDARHRRLGQCSERLDTAEAPAAGGARPAQAPGRRGQRDQEAGGGPPGERGGSEQGKARGGIAGDSSTVGEISATRRPEASTRACAVSVSRARLPVTTLPTACASTIRAVRPKAIARRVRAVSGEAWLWPCPCAWEAVIV